MHLRDITGGIRSLLYPHKRNAEIEAEARSFRDAAVEHRMRQGMSREDAERAMRRELGNIQNVGHKVWSAGWESLAESLWRDAAYGLRQVMRSPGLSIVAILSLALGIGANTAIFTVIDDLLLKQLPVRDPRMLVSFGDGNSGGIVASTSPGPYDIFPYDFYRRIAGPESELESICAFSSFPTMVSVRAASAAAGPATQAQIHLVSGSFFTVLGAQPLLGRVFSPADTATEGSNAVAVISHRYWQEDLSSDPAVLGRSITINGTSFTRHVAAHHHATGGDDAALAPQAGWAFLDPHHGAAQVRRFHRAGTGVGNGRTSTVPHRARREHNPGAAQAADCRHFHSSLAGRNRAVANA